MRLPQILFVIATTASLTSALAPSARANGLPVCNAKHKRPANPYGSVLSEGLKPALTAAAPGKSPFEPVGFSADAKAAGTAAAKPQQVSRAEWPASFAPCGSDRA